MTLPPPEAAASRRSTGLRYMVLAAFFFSLMGVLVKIAGQRLPSAELVLGRSVVALVLSYGMLRRAGVAPWGRRKGLLAFRGLAGSLSLLCVFYALTKLPLADATVLQYTNPVFTAILAALFLQEIIGGREVIGLLFSLAGVVLVAQPAFLFGTAADSLDLVAVGVALLGAVLAAMAYATVRKLRETEHHLVVVFYFPLIATPASVPFMASDALWPTPLEWLLLLGIGVSTQIAQVYLTKGLHIEKAGRAMSMSYVQIIFAALWGFFFFSEAPDLLGILGALLVVAGTLVVARAQ
jgi:drug/metabolite transporter (DMT)-like permease